MDSVFLGITISYHLWSHIYMYKSNLPSILNAIQNHCYGFFFVFKFLGVFCNDIASSFLYIVCLFLLSLHSNIGVLKHTHMKINNTSMHALLQYTNLYRIISVYFSCSFCMDVSACICVRLFYTIVIYYRHGKMSKWHIYIPFSTVFVIF